MIFSFPTASVESVRMGPFCKFFQFAGFKKATTEKAEKPRSSFSSVTSSSDWWLNHLTCFFIWEM